MAEKYSEPSLVDEVRETNEFRAKVTRTLVKHREKINTRSKAKITTVEDNTTRDIEKELLREENENLRKLLQAKEDINESMKDFKKNRKILEAIGRRLDFLEARDKGIQASDMKRDTKENRETISNDNMNSACPMVKISENAVANIKLKGGMAKRSLQRTQIFRA